MKETPKTIKIIKKIPQAVKNPERALELFWTRMFPIGIKPKDKEAYRIAGWKYGSLPRVHIQELFPQIGSVDIQMLRVMDRRIGTSLDGNELMLLLTITKFIRAKHVLEIGTWDGNTTLNFAANIPSDGSVTTVDLPPNWNGEMALKIPQLCLNVTDRSRVGLQYKNTIHEKKIHQIYEDSAKVTASKFQKKFDLAFIDGCHHYHYVENDTKLSLECINSGGIIIWHDYGMIKDVAQVVDKVAKRMKVCALRGTRLAVGFVK